MAENKTLKEAEFGARDIISGLFDEESFVETGKHFSPSVITGCGTVNGAPVYTFVQDVTEKSGAVDSASASKIKKLYDAAVSNGAPVIAFYNSKGGDIKENAALLNAFGGIASGAAKLSGVVPQISVVTGMCTGVLAAVCRMADFVIMTEASELFLSSPSLTPDGKLDGAGKAVNAAKSGAADIMVKDCGEAIEKAKKLISLLPQNNLEIAGNDYYEENSEEITAGLKGADLISAAADVDSLIELGADFGSSAYTALGSLNWRTVGFVSAGKTVENKTLSAADCSKIARFVNICDAFSIPVVTVADTEGFEPNSGAELAGSVRDAAKLAQVYYGATIPKINIVTGNAAGAAFIALGGLGAGADILLAYENAVITPVSPKAAAVFLYPEKLSGKTPEALTDEYIKEEANAMKLAEKGCIDRIIEPEETKKALLSALEILSSKRASSPNRKHINPAF